MLSSMLGNDAARVMKLSCSICRRASSGRFERWAMVSQEVGHPVDSEKLRQPAGGRREWLSTLRYGLIVVLVGYLAVAYVILPMGWWRYEKRHPALTNAPTLTHTKLGIPGDPLNVGFVGSEEQLIKAFHAIGWTEAEKIDLKSSVGIAESTVLDRPDAVAPVSSLYLFGRKQDLAFELPVGESARQRHHVRLWRCEEKDDQGRLFWIGSVTFDERVGLSHTTEEITHHISPDVDGERDGLLNSMLKARQIEAIEYVDDFQPKAQGKNGGGDPWKTDQRLGWGTLID